MYLCAYSYLKYNLKKQKFVWDHRLSVHSPDQQVNVELSDDDDGDDDDDDDVLRE